MTVAKLIQHLKQLPPSAEVQVWDNRRHCFADDFDIQHTMLNDVLITPISEKDDNLNPQINHSQL